MATPIAPDRWPAVRKEECFNGEAYRASIKRRLFQQQVYDYVHGQHVLSAWGSTGDWPTGGLKLRPNGGATSEDGPITIGYFIVPEGMGFPEINVVVRYSVDGASAEVTDYAYVDFTPVGLDRAVTATIPRTAGENTATVTLPASPEGTIWKAVFRLADTAAADTDYVYVVSISAYWRPPTASELGIGTLPSDTWRAMSQTHWAGGRPESSAALVWAMEMQARQYVYRPRPCWHQYFGTTNTNSTTATRVWSGNVYFPAKAGASPQCQLKFGAWQTASTTGYRVSVWVDGVQQAETSTITPSATYELAEQTLDFAAPSRGEHHVEVKIRMVEAGHTAELLYCAGHSLEQSPTLAGSDTLPTSFEVPSWQRVQAGEPIFELENLDAEKVGIETLIKNVYWLERYHVSRGLWSSAMYRWRPFGTRGANDNPGFYSIAGDGDTDTTMPTEGGTNRRYDRRLHFGSAGDASSRRRYRYYFGISMGRIDLNDQGQFSSSVLSKIVHGSFTSDEIDYSQLGLDFEGTERPDVLWMGPFRYDEDMTGSINDLNLDLYRASRNGDTAPILAGALVIGEPRET